MIHHPSSRSRLTQLAVTTLLALLVGLGGTASASGEQTTAAPYEAAIRDHGWSADALVRLGHAYEETGKRGLAIVAFERAHLLAPRADDVTRTLEAARAAAGSPALQHSRVHDTIGQLTPDEWTWIALGGAFVACAGIVGYAWRYRRPTTRTLAIAGSMIGLLGGAAAFAVAPSPDRAIVTTTSTARISPFTAAEAAFETLEGEPVQIEHARSGFFFVRDGDRAGWLPQTAVTRVVPDA